jgi:signal transduction histidine kinase
VGETRDYVARVEGERVQIEAQPVRAPTAARSPTGAPPGAVIGVLLVGKLLRDVDDTLGLLRVLLLIIGALTLGGALAGGWIIASRVLRPLAEIGAAARAIAATTAEGTRLGNLSMRVRRPPGEDEMAQVVDTLNGMLAALDSATTAQRRFVADASHELRAPLTTVQGNLAILQRHLDELPPDERRTMLADAHAETLRLARLVDDLLLLARADAQSDGDGDSAPGNPPGAPGAPTAPVHGPVELDRALLQLVRQLRGRLAAEGSAVTLDVGRVEPARVRGDEETLRRIVLILLDNAIKYTPPGAGPVTVSLEREGGQAVLRVRDRGIGIDAADLPHIFERFYRADRARDRQGTGLGLAIAQALAEQVGARLTAASSPCAGSTFSLYLPLA